MWLNTLRFTSLLFTAIALGAGLAHLLELVNKMKLSAADYFTVQKMYRGWSLLGIVVIVSFVSTLMLAIKQYKHNSFALILAALLCIAATQLVFWIFTYPVNVQTKNWTVLPADWVDLRRRWEFSHAAGALLNLTALILLILALLQRNEAR